MKNTRISVVTPTFLRAEEVRGLLENISNQSLLPEEVILVDGAPNDDRATELVIGDIKDSFPFLVKYIRHGGGTAIQRNIGIDAATGGFIAFVDDDVRLRVDFLDTIIKIFWEDKEQKVGGIVGYRTNQHFTTDGSMRWRWYKRLRLLTVFEPGRYDHACGYPINANLQPQFKGTREVDFMTTACAVWRKRVFESGLRFDEFFKDYGMLEDAHFSLRAGQKWRLLQAGEAHCEELHSPRGRVDRRKIGYKSVVNYYFVFNDVFGPLSALQKIRFSRYQAFELCRLGFSAVRRRRLNDLLDVFGRLNGIWRIFRGQAAAKNSRIL